MAHMIAVASQVRLFVEDWGEGKPIVFIHGWPVDARNWEYQFTSLAEQGYRCLGIDLRGFGRSDKPWGFYNFDLFADDVHTILDQLDLREVTLVGHSMGAAVALHTVSRLPQRVAKLVLCGAATPCLTKKADFPQGLETAPYDGLLAAILADRPQALADFGNSFFLRDVSPAFRSWFHGLGMHASAWATAQCVIALRDADLRPDMAQVKVPTAILHGVHDQVAPIAITAEVLAQGIAGSQLHRFENSGHGLFYDERDRFNMVLRNFVG